MSAQFADLHGMCGSHARNEYARKSLEGTLVLSQEKRAHNAAANILMSSDRACVSLHGWLCLGFKFDVAIV